MGERTVRQEKIAMVKESYYTITGDALEAMILNQMIYWSQRVSDYDKLVAEENSRRRSLQDGVEDIPVSHGWIHKTAAELKDELMSDSSAKTILRKLDDLVDKGYLDRRNNPDFSYDRTYQYRVNLLAVFDDLQKYGFQLAGFKIDTIPDGAEKDCPVELPKNDSSESDGQAEKSKGQHDFSNGHCDHWKGQGENFNFPGVPAIPETTTETILETTPSPSYSPKKAGKVMENEDDTGTVSDILKATGVDTLRHRDMIAPIRAILSDLLINGKVGRNQFHRDEIEKAVKNLTANAIDGVIDAFSENRNIKRPDDYLKACLLSAGRNAEYKALAGKSCAKGIHSGNPSFDIDEYVSLSMAQLHREGEGQ